MRNLVLGSEGFVGGPFCQFLESRGQEVIRYDLKRSASEDLRHARLKLDGVDRVFVLAWDVGGAKYLYREDSQLGQLDWNLALLSNTMHQLGDAKVPFLFVSSQLADEVDTVYGVLKRLGEVWTRLLGGRCVRLWNIYGPLEETSERTHVVSDLVHQAVLGGCIRLLTTGEERRTFTHIDDACRALLHSFDVPSDCVYDVSSYEWNSVLQVARMIADHAGAVLEIGQRVGIGPRSPIRARMPGWLPQVELRDGLRRMVDTLKAARNTPQRA
jgi:nucleoside-diphosphate-sugar epimerase